jgi:bifunctional non-homologous end joining protein LigD
MSPVVSKRPRHRPVAIVDQAKSAPYPRFIEFCDPTLRERAPAGDEWVHGIKVDGYRAQIHIRDGKVIAYSRSGYDWTEQFAAIGSLCGLKPDIMTCRRSANAEVKPLTGP